MWWIGLHLCKHRWIKLVKNMAVFSVTGTVLFLVDVTKNC